MASQTGLPEYLIVNCVRLADQSVSGFIDWAGVTRTGICTESLRQSSRYSERSSEKGFSWENRGRVNKDRKSIMVFIVGLRSMVRINGERVKGI